MTTEDSAGAFAAHCAIRAGRFDRFLEPEQPRLGFIAEAFLRAAAVQSHMFGQMLRGETPTFPEWMSATPTPAEPERCGATEGATGIECELIRYHSLSVDHEGSGTDQQIKALGYKLFVRWPWQTYDRDHALLCAASGEVQPNA